MIPIFRSSDTENLKRILHSGETQLKKAEAAARRFCPAGRQPDDPLHHQQSRRERVVTFRFIGSARLDGVQGRRQDLKR